MLGLVLGAAFLTGFGFGAFAVDVWLGLGMVAVARQSLTLVSFMAVLVLASLGAVHAEWQQAPAAVAVATGSFEGTVQVTDGPYLTRLGQRFLVRADHFGELRVC